MHEPELWVHIVKIEVDALAEFECELKLVSFAIRLYFERTAHLQSREDTDQTFRNTGNKPIERGIWDVTQILRPFEVYLPGSMENFRAYKDEGLIKDAQTKIEEHAGCIKISCDDTTHFKFGGLIDQGTSRSCLREDTIQAPVRRAR